MSISKPNHRNIPYPVLIIAGCCALMTSGIAIPLNCAGFFYTPVSEELGTGTGPFSLYMTIQYIVMALMLPMAGKILSTKNIRLALSAAVLLYALGFGAMGFYSSLFQFYLSGVLMGIGGAFIIYLPVPILINNWFKEKVGLAMGLAYAFIGLGAAVFSPITGYLLTTFGWRTAYVSLALMMALISLPFTLCIIRRTPEELGLQPYGKKQDVQVFAASDTSGICKSAALKMPAFYMSFLFAGLLGLLAAIMYHLPSYISSNGSSTAVVSTCMSAAMIGTTCGKLWIGYLNDRIGVALAAPVGILTGFAGILAVMFGTNLMVLAIGMFLFGIGFSCTVLEPPLVVKGIFGNRDYSSIYSYVMVASSTGTALGASLLGFLRDATGTYMTSLIAVLGMQLLAVCMVVMAMRTKKTAMAEVAG